MSFFRWLEIYKQQYTTMTSHLEYLLSETPKQFVNGDVSIVK